MKRKIISMLMAMVIALTTVDVSVFASEIAVNKAENESIAEEIQCLLQEEGKFRENITDAVENTEEEKAEQVEESEEIFEFYENIQEDENGLDGIEQRFRELTAMEQKQETEQEMASDFTESMEVVLGQCGDNATWSLENGILTISGIGSMRDYDLETETPWYGRKDEITKVVIEDGITRIGNNAFRMCQNLLGVTLPDSVACIGAYAFYQCQGMVGRLNFPDTITSIEMMAFFGCTKITGIDLPKRIQSIEMGVFAACFGLTEDIEIPSTVTNIGAAAFMGCKELGSIFIPDSVTSIGESVFQDNNDIVIYGKPGSYAESYANTNNKTFVANTGVCGELVTWFFKKDTLIISGTGAMWDYETETERPWHGIKDKIKYLIIEEGIIRIGKNAFRQCQNLLEVSLSDSVTSIGESAFYQCQAMAGKLILSDSVTSIETMAFFGCTKVTGIELPEGLRSIELGAFAACFGLIEDVEIPSTVTNIGAAAFMGCKELGSIFIPESVTNIGESVFQDNTDIIIYGKPGSYAESYANANSITFAANTGACGEQATWFLKKDTLIISGTGAMWDYEAEAERPWHGIKDKIKYLIIEEGITRIGKNAFQQCQNLLDMTMADSVTGIGERAFYYCQGMTGMLILPENLISIENMAFLGCTKITGIELPEGLNSIGVGAFAGCFELLEDVVIPSTVTNIGAAVFMGCKVLEGIFIPSSVISIGESAFQDITNLTIYGEPGSYVESYANANNIHFVGNAGTCGEQAIWYLKGGTIIISGTGAMYDYESVSETPWNGMKDKINYLIIEEGITRVGKNSFRQSPNLWEVTMSDTVTSIGESAFYQCQGIEGEMDLPDSVTSIENMAFFGCTDVTEIKLPKLLRNIGIGAFAGCFDLTGIVEIPGKVSIIEAGAFMGCAELEGIKIPPSVTAIGDSVFENVMNLIIYGEPGSYAESYAQANNISFVSWITAQIPDDALVFNRHYYKVYPKKMTWREAQAFCEQKGGHLVTISDEAENQVVFNYIMENNIEQAFMGIYWEDSQWKWITKEKVTYSNWAAGEPDNITGAEHYGSMSYDKVGKWSDAENGDITNNTLQGFICEWDEKKKEEIIPDGMREDCFLTVEKNKYAIRVLDKNDLGLEGAIVTYGKQTGITNSEGIVIFDLFTVGTPEITITKENYVTWSNVNTNWTKKEERYEEIRLYQEGNGAEYLLKYADYINNGKHTDLLIRTKKVGLDSSDAWDLDDGKFEISCQAYKAYKVSKYILMQNDRKIAESTSGMFELHVDSFEKGGNCYIISVPADDLASIVYQTKLNLEFINQDTVEETSVQLSDGGDISINVGSGVPFIGGSRIKFKMPALIPIEIKRTNDKVKIGFNMKLDGEDTVEKWKEFENSYKKYQKSKVTLKKGSYQSTKNKLKGLIKESNKCSFLGLDEVDIYVIGYAEADAGTTSVGGKLYLIMDVNILGFSRTFVVGAVPLVLNIDVNGELNVGGEILFNLQEQTFGNNLFAEPKVSFKAFGGVGVGKIIAVGAYGEAGASAEFKLGTESGLQSADIEGELGIEAYVAIFKYIKTFAYHKWNLYSKNNVRSLTTLAENSEDEIYAAQNYTKEDFSYLIKESEWNGYGNNSRRRSVGSQGVSMNSLLENTYRNAQPKTAAGENGMYITFLKAEADTEKVQAVISRFDGQSWSQPTGVLENYVLDDAPELCMEEKGNLWIAYTRAGSGYDAANVDLMNYAENRELVVARLHPQTMQVEEYKVFQGEGYINKHKIECIDEEVRVVFADSEIQSEDQVIAPEKSKLYTISVQAGNIGQPDLELEVEKPIHQLMLGKKDGNIGIAYTVEEETGVSLYYCKDNTEVQLADSINGEVKYEVFPGTTEMEFLWNDINKLVSESGKEISAEGINVHYDIVGNSLYYSQASDEEGYNTLIREVVVDENGFVSNAILQLANTRYLEELSVQQFEGQNYLFGMNTKADINETELVTSKNLVWGATVDVSDIGIMEYDYDDTIIDAGEEISVQMKIVNNGRHTVNKMDIYLDDTYLDTYDVNLLPGKETEINIPILCPENETTYSISIAETGHRENDVTISDNSLDIVLCSADLEVDAKMALSGKQKGVVVSVKNNGGTPAAGKILLYDVEGELDDSYEFSSLDSRENYIGSFWIESKDMEKFNGDIRVVVETDANELDIDNNVAILNMSWNETVTDDEDMETVTFTVSFNSTGGSKVAEQIVEENQKAKKPQEPVLEGYIFKGWYLGNELYDFETPVTSDLMLEAKWEKEEVQKETLLLPISNIPSGSVVEKGTEILLSGEIEGVKIYYTLDGTNPTINSTLYTTPMVLTETTTIKAIAVKEGYNNSEIAVFTYTITETEAVNFAVSFNSNGGSKVAGQIVEENQKAKKPQEPTLEGYIFKGWYLGNELYDFEIPVTSDITLTAKWEIIGDVLYEDIPSDGIIPDGIWLAGIKAAVYNGNAIKPSFRVYDGTKMLKEKTDYILTYKNNKNAYAYTDEDYAAFEETLATTGKKVKTGTFDPKMAAQVIIKMKDNYSGSQTVYFKIEQANFKENGINAENLTVTYNGNKQTPTPKVTWNGKTLKYGKDYYIPEYDNAKNNSNAFKMPQTETLTITGKGNFIGTLPITLTISESAKQVAMNRVTVKGIKNLKWTGESLSQNGLKVTYKKDILSEENGDYSIQWGENKDVGVGTVTFIGTGKDTDGDGYSYIGKKTVAFKIMGNAMSKAVITGMDKRYDYTGKEICPTATLTYKENKYVESFSMVENVHYTVKYERNKEKGTATAVFTGLESGGFVGVKKQTFKIVAADLKEFVGGDKNTGAVTITFKDTQHLKHGIYEALYLKGGAKPEIIVISGDLELKEGVDYTVSYTNYKKLSLSNGDKAPTVTIKGKGNFKGNKSITYSIVPKALTKENGITLAAIDKAENGKRNGYQTKFKVYDADGKALEKTEYDVNSITYTLISTTNDDGIVTKENKVLDKDSIVNAGSEICITVKGKGIYAGGEVSGTYRILKKEHDISKAIIQITPQKYTGKPILITEQSQFKNGAIYLKIGRKKKELILGKDIEVVSGSYIHNEEKGKAKVTFRGVNDFGGTKTVTYQIGSRSIEEFWKGISGKIAKIFQ